MEVNKQFPINDERKLLFTNNSAIYPKIIELGGNKVGILNNQLQGIKFCNPHLNKKEESLQFKQNYHSRPMEQSLQY